MIRHKNRSIYPTLRKPSLILIAISILAPLQAKTFPEEARSYFKDWLVVCQKSSYSSDAVGACRANVSIRNRKLNPYGDGTIFQLTLQRSAGSGYHIEFYHTLDDSYPSNEVTLKVDNHPAVTLKVHTEGNLAKLTTNQSSPFILLIKSGRWLGVSYTSQAGKHIKMDVSLRGSTASSLFVDNFYYNRGY